MPETIRVLCSSGLDVVRGVCVQRDDVVVLPFRKCLDESVLCLLGVMRKRQHLLEISRLAGMTEGGIVQAVEAVTLSGKAANKGQDYLGAAADQQDV
ncbi:hypothetical protein [Ectothiorhodospira marina]|uniref:hypothetical protein n=1 Tax=Ectothiorhodospira marina TaxID=1396821 RepID=UPI001FE03799|nr:hypothetical protein [Ectothiorhodospira marina]